MGKRLFLAILALTVGAPSLTYAQGALNNGGTHSAAISAPAEIDMWTFDASLGDAILLSIGEVVPAGADPDFRPWIRLRRPDGVEIGSDTGLLAAQINDVAPLSGTYTVLVRDYALGRPGTSLGDYLLHFVRVPGDLTVPGGDEGGVMSNGDNHAGSIHRADLDPWTFTAAQNDAIVVSVGEMLDSEIDPDFRPWIRLYGPNGALLGSDTGLLAATLSETAPLTGTYTVIVADYSLGREGSSLGDYVLHLVKAPGVLTIPDEDDGGPMTNGANHAGRIGAPGETPTLHRADLDPWTFTAAQNDSIIVTIGEVLDSEIDPDFRPWIRLYGPNGALLGSDTGLLAATLSETAPLTGTYTVVVADYSLGREGSAVGDYVLHLIKAPGELTVPVGDDGGTMTNAANHAGRIGAPGGKPTLHRADLDPWTFLGAQGAAITVSISELLPAGPDPDFRPWIRLYGPTGTLVRSDTGLLAASINLNAPSSGLYTVVVADYGLGREGSAVGDYVLTVHGAVDSVPLLPTSVGESYQTAMGTTLTIPTPGVLANDNTNGGGPMTAVLVSPVTSGSLALAANGGFVYTPAAGFAGNAAFTYRAQNSAGSGNIATVAIAVTSLPPTTTADGFVVHSDTPLNVAAPGVLANDSANGGGALTAELVASPANGVLNLASNGGFSYTPNPGFAGIDNFSYRAVSSAGPGNSAVVSITVETTDAQPPTGLYVASVVGNTITLRWTPPVVGPAPTTFVLEGGVSPGAVQASIVMDQAPVYTFQAPDGAFFIRVHTIAGTQRSAASNEVPLFVNVPVPPSAPANLLGLVNGSTLGLGWRNTFAGGAPESLILDVTGTLATSIPLGLTDNFAFDGVPPGTYTLSLRAVNAAGVSASSNPITLTFPGACSGPPLMPDNFVAYRVGNTIHVIWDPAESGPAPTSYVLNVTGAFVASIPTPTRALSGGVGPGSYHLSVVATNPCGSSPPTPVQVVVVP